MARVALIETYPYEAVCGGDSVYLDAIRQFLTARGHRVDSYVTDITRGRSNPSVALQTRAVFNHRWHVRNAVPLGGGRFCSLDPRMAGKALRRVPGQRAAKDDRVNPAEADWVVDELERSPPDLTILAFGACGFTDRVVATGAKVIALKGFFSDRRIRLGELVPTPFVGAELLESLSRATAAAFNNLYDLNLYQQLSQRHNGALVGIGLPNRMQPAAKGDPALLYVAARTKPNVESLAWFLDQVWPIVHSAAPSARFRVAGSVGSAFATSSFPQVDFVGFVDQIEDEYRKSWAVAAPFVDGSSGLKTKITEALSFGRPVITTSIGIDPGQRDQFGEAVAVADDPRAFASALLDILHDEPLRRAWHLSAVDQFARHFTPAAAYGPILDLIEPVSADRRLATT